jgi:preprotein translocase subunit SecG
MLYLLLILIIIASALLVVIILAQNPKDGGLTNIGSSASQFLGARQTADFLEKSTWYFGIGILAIVIFTYFLTGSPNNADNGPKFRTEGAEDYTPTGVHGKAAPQAPAPAIQPQQKPAPAPAK